MLNGFYRVWAFWAVWGVSFSYVVDVLPTLSLWSEQLIFLFGCVCLLSLGILDVWDRIHFPVVCCSHVCFHLEAMAWLIIFLCSVVVSGMVLSVVLLFRACLAALSADSLPCIPTCTGVHTILTVFPLLIISLLFCRI